MSTHATVREWHVDESWGVVDSDQTPGGCWVHYSAIAVAGYRALVPRQAVELEWAAGCQDGFDYRARRVWPAGTEPVTTEPSPPRSDEEAEVLLSFTDGQPTIDCCGVADKVARHDGSDVVPESIQLRLGDHGH